MTTSNSHINPSTVGSTPAALTTKTSKTQLTDEERAKITFNPWTYDITVWIFSRAFHLFFREIRSYGAFRIPKSGPVIFVCAPHANQFVDPMLVMQQAQIQANRRISFLVAEVSHRQPLIGSFTHLTHSIPVVRPQDNLKPASGKIFVDFDKDPLGVRGQDTKFTTELSPKGILGLSRVGNAEISEIVSDTKLILRKEFSSPRARELLAQGTSYKFAPHVDQAVTFRNVFNHLRLGGCIGIYPEGGSHDRSDLLPLKAGVAIMALGANAADPDCNIKIVTVGMNYFHPDKFRSRAVLEFGKPMDISPELVKDYRSGGARKREAVKTVLDSIAEGLRAVTVRCPDWETLEAIQAARRLYSSSSRKMPLSLVVDINRRFVEGYERVKDEPGIIELRQKILDYNKELVRLGIQDHQVKNALMSTWLVIGKLLIYTTNLLVLVPLAAPGTILFSPVFVASRVISKMKQEQALAGSSVKIHGKDVVATWKILVAMGFAPLLYLFYSVVATWITLRSQLVSQTRYLAPSLVAFGIFFIIVTYVALLIGETVVDISKSLKPLVMSLSGPYCNALADIQCRRRELAVNVTSVVNDLGTQFYPGFDFSGPPPSTHTSNTIHSLSEHSKLTDSKQDRFETSEPEDSANGLHPIHSNTSHSSLGNMPLLGHSDDEPDSTGISRIGSGSNSRAESDTEDSYHLSATGRNVFETQISKRIRESLSENARNRAQTWIGFRSFHFKITIIKLYIKSNYKLSFHGSCVPCISNMFKQFVFAGKQLATNIAF